MSVSLGFGLLVLSYSDNLPYAFCEQIGKEIRDISDEIPFEIPESWEWVRFASIIELQSGQDLTPEKYNAEEKGLPYITGASNIDNETVIINRWTEHGKAFAYKGDILLTCKGTVGTIAILDCDKVHIARQIMAIRPMNRMYIKYIKIVLETLVENLQNSAKSIIPGITRDDVLFSLIPLPPLAEQHGIVSKIEELLPYIEEYDKAETELSALNTSFPEMLKKSILQEAVQGKLVPQDPNDEPASVLLERIKAEKQRLIKEGKIKKDKHGSVIVTRDKIPYEIPDSWEWCKLSDLAILENGDRSSKYPVEADYVESGIPFFGAKDIDGEMMSFQNVRFISQQKYDELGNGKLVDGDIICLLRGSVGKTTKFEANEQFNTGFICAQMLIIRLLDKSLFGYISSYFKSPDYTNYVESKVTGTAVRQMPAKEMGNLLIPLPPLNEQHRIVSKIEEIMPYINTITK